VRNPTLDKSKNTTKTKKSPRTTAKTASQQRSSSDADVPPAPKRKRARKPKTDEDQSDTEHIRRGDTCAPLWNADDDDDYPVSSQKTKDLVSKAGERDVSLLEGREQDWTEVSSREEFLDKCCGRISKGAQSSQAFQTLCVKTMNLMATTDCPRRLKEVTSTFMTWMFGRTRNTVTSMRVV